MSELKWTGERYVPAVQGEIRLEHVHRYLIARELCGGKRVLDIASGEGYGSNILASVSPAVVGVDNAADAVVHAQHRYGSRPNLKFCIGNLHEIPLRSSSVDAVVCFETIEHVEQQDHAIREIRRVLTDDGLLIISTPDRREYTDVVGNQNPYHTRELDFDEFCALLRVCFREVSVAGQRVRGGSIVGPLDGTSDTKFVTFPSDPGAQPVAGLRAPLYFLAVATNGALPAMPVGLFEGKRFILEHDLAHLLAQVQRQCTEEIAIRLGQPTSRSEASPDDVRAEFVRVSDRVFEVSAQTRELERQLLDANVRLSTTYGELTNEIRELTNEIRSLQHQLLDANVQLARTHVAHVESRAAASAHLAGEKTLEQRVVALRADLAALRSTADAEISAAQASEAAFRALAVAQQVQIESYERSRSWRLTRPLRDLRRFGSRTIRTIPQPPQRPPVPVTEAASRTPTMTDTAPAALGTPTRANENWQSDHVPLGRFAPIETRLKLIAFYLPQFHPIPENDAWWGKGFTEWRNVTRAKPQFAGHYQPHLPGELGFYDLRLFEVQTRQIELAKLHGIHGFCFHHYWFAGKRLLREPVDQFLRHPEVDFRFCLCWANENWTRRWDGLDTEVLIGQEHSAEDDVAFLRDIEPALRDPRYIRIAGRPVLVVYRPALLPDPAATAARWRAYALHAGIGDLYLVSTQAFDNQPPQNMGFDAALEFPPINVGISPTTNRPQDLNPDFHGKIYDYRELVEGCVAREMPSDYILFRGVTPMWDNEARRPTNGSIFVHSTPELYQRWLEQVCRWTDRHRTPDDKLIFVNAWNEWAEGNHLEPDQRFGYAYLNATAEALERFPLPLVRPSIVLVSHDAHFYGAQVLALALVRTLVHRFGYNVEVLLCGPGVLRSDFESVAGVHDFFGSHETRETKLATLERLYDRGSRIAICNTSVVGEAVELLKQTGFLVISLIHELPELIRAYRLEGSVAQITQHADRVVFGANVVRQRFAELTGLSPERSVVQPQGLIAPNEFFGRREVARRELRTQFKLPLSARLVLAVGNADRRKGVDLFVDVGLRVLAETHDVWFVWVGHQNEEFFQEVRRRVDDSPYRERFVFPGAVRASDVFFAGADAYLMTSREDPFPNVVLQALDGGIPVIGFEGAGGFAELLERGCGLLVPFADTVAMSEALLQVLNSPADTTDLVIRASEILTREFSFVNYVRSLIEMSGQRRPRVTVILPNYNYGRYLAQRIQSIIDQTYQPYEVIFLDDCSNDDSWEIATKMLHASGLAYRVIRNETNLGTYRQWLRGLQEATGDLIWIAEADDHCEPTMLAKLVEPFDEPAVVLAYCESRQVDENDTELAPDYHAYTAEIDSTKWRTSYVRAGIDEIRDTLSIKNTIPNVSAVLMRKMDTAEIEEKLLGLKNAGDWLLYVHLLKNGKIAYVPEALNAHRRHRHSVTIGGNELNLMREILMVQKYVLEHHGCAPGSEQIREASLQQTYEYLGLHVQGAASYKANQALRELDWPN